MSAAATSLAIMAVLLAPGAAPPEEPAPPFHFKVACRRDNDRVDVKLEGSKATFDVFCPFGIGHAKITPADRRWPETVVLRLHLRGLESLDISNGTVTLHGFVHSHGEHKRHLSLKKKGEEKKDTEDTLVKPGSPYWMEIRVLRVKSKPGDGYPPKNGLFEMTLPKALLRDRPESLEIHWIDFYRQ